MNISVQSGQSTDIFSAEIIYHMSCYKRFTSVKIKTDFEENREQKLQESTFNDFLAKIDLSITALHIIVSITYSLYIDGESEIQSQLHHESES